MTHYKVLKDELRFAREKLASYGTDQTLAYRAEYSNRLIHAIEYLEDRIDDFKREHAL